MTSLTAEEHDRAAAYTQALPHAAILSFAGALMQASESHALTMRLATPIHSSMLSLLARIISGEPDLYCDIQSENPYAAEVREQLRLAVARLNEAVNGGESDYFSNLFGQISATLGGDRVPLTEAASRIVECTKGI